MESLASGKEYQTEPIVGFFFHLGVYRYCEYFKYLKHYNQLKVIFAIKVLFLIRFLLHCKGKVAQATCRQPQGRSLTQFCSIKQLRSIPTPSWIGC